MTDLQLELDDVRMVFKNADIHHQRAQYISQLTFKYVQELIDKKLLHLHADVVVKRLEVPPVQVSFDTMADESIARLCASGIYRAIIQSL